MKNEDLTFTFKNIGPIKRKVPLKTLTLQYYMAAQIQENHLF